MIAIMKAMKSKEINNFCDLHSHVLFGIDDGASTLEESLEILKKAAQEGITKMMVTPHYMENTSYSASNETKKKLFHELEVAKEKEHIPIELFLGNEIYLTANILELLQKEECLTLNETHYVLVELPMHNEMLGASTIFFDMIRHGYQPILAHPERYRYFQKDIEKVKEYLDLGVLLQGNYQSLLGLYGKEAKKTLEQLLKMDAISFLGSDVHHTKPFEMASLYKKLRKLGLKEEKIQKIVEKNFEKVISSEK